MGALEGWGMRCGRTILCGSILALVTSGPAVAQDQSCAVKRGKIVGGSQASIANWPGQATLRLHSASGRVSWYFCGVSLPTKATRVKSL